ncbi:MAG: hypothetical protein K9N34_02380 [Candidatus Marinimicrobia bacterium]|nr:hypothetical protein [Candidatus Neomarinimicrobiota bacterium]MCF7839737.1 hypothetical protein [Candidatus Neomarinimicrobiota bacterium]MCF7902549.1 hypothetical protein [Candidatus Neomarinimicrobiota bacterium]
MKIFHTIMMTLLILGMTVIVASTLYDGWSYYQLPQEVRLAQEYEAAHTTYGSAGLVGHGLGILAGIFFLGMFLYVFRKRLRFMRGWGKLSIWLRYHIFMGISAPILATLHSAFKFQGLISVGYFSMVAVALSGFVGRYLYGHIPRRKSGEELTLKQIHLDRAETLRRLEFEFGLKGEDIQQLVAFSIPKEIERWGVLNLFRILFEDVNRRFQARRLARYFQHKYGLPPREVRYLTRAIARQRLIMQRIAFFDTIHKIFHWWHVIHKPFAYTVLVILILHVAITVSFGYTWIY